MQTYELFNGSVVTTLCLLSSIPHTLTQQPAPPQGQEGGHLVGDTDGTGFGIGVVCPFLLGSLHSVVCTIRFLSLSLLQASSSVKHPASSMAATRKVRAVTKQASEVRKKDSKPMVAQSEANENGQEQKSPMESVPWTRPSTPPPRSEAFEQFKQERGSEINKILLLNKGEH